VLIGTADCDAGEVEVDAMNKGALAWHYAVAESVPKVLPMRSPFGLFAQTGAKCG
jgi:hypothetical protein